MSEFTTIIKKRDEHCISRKNIDPDAMTVLYRLKNSGQTAYLVGGSVRDLLIGRKPKDFDISTDAHPRKVKQLFRNSFLIGKRFKLVHVKFGDKTIEVSTFRKKPEQVVDGDFESGELLQFHDNTFGTPEEDARRRDFTINGLFYDLRTFSIIDHVGGLADVEHRVIRSIGDPNIRFQEDPVRMVRAIRFAARLKFQIEPETWSAIQRHHELIHLASKPRMLEELFRLFAFGASERAFRLMNESGLLKEALPEVATFLSTGGSHCDMMWRSLAALDARTGLEPDREPLPRLMLSALFLPMVLRQMEQQPDATQDQPCSAIATELLHPFITRFHLPKTILFPMMYMFDAQTRLARAPFDNKREKRARIMKFVTDEAFRCAVALRKIHITATLSDQPQQAEAALAVVKLWEDLRNQQPQDRTDRDQYRHRRHSRRPQQQQHWRDKPPQHAAHHDRPDDKPPKQHRFGLAKLKSFFTKGLRRAKPGMQ